MIAFFRLLNRGLFACMATLALAAGAQAQTYPTKPVTLIVPYPAGGSADILARVVGEKLGKRLGQTVVVENKGGAGTAIGAEAAATAPADGYTLMIGTVSSHAMNPSMKKVPYDPIKDFTPISRLASIPFVIVADPALKLDNLKDLIALAKRKPGAVTYSSAGLGTSNHLAVELLAAKADIKLLHIPYKGSAPALNALLGGQVDIMFDLQATAEKYVKAGKLDALAITGTKRSPLLPDVPTVAESGFPNYDVTAWFGLFAPAGVPQPVIDKLNHAVVAVMKSADVRERLLKLGAEPEYSTPAEFASFVRGELSKWGEVIKRTGLAQSAK
jgi:tripartite-type tricarboxylate transporter receptor subunit TctC